MPRCQLLLVTCLLLSAAGLGPALASPALEVNTFAVVHG
jgi:hypothetical protein